MPKTNLRRLTMAAMLGAIAFILMYFKVSIPVLSPFADLDLSALPELFGGFILGPLGGVLIIVVKLVLKLVFQGTNSMFTGEVQNLLLSLAYVLPAVLYYRHHRTKKGAVIGLVLGSLCSIVVAVITNLYLIFPAYMKLYGMDWQSILSAFSAANPWIKDIPTMVAFSVVPFNLLSRAITSVLVFLLYKKLSVPMKHLIQ